MKITLADRFRIAGKELLRLNVGNVVKSFTWPEYAFTIDPSNYPGGIVPTGDLFSGNAWMFDVDGHGDDRYFSYAGHSCALKAYMLCPPVAAIINRKAQAFANGNTWIINTAGKSKDKESTNPAATKIRNLLRNPNMLQNGKQFESQLYMYVQLFGFAVVLVDKPYGFPAMEANAMWVLPNWMLQIYESMGQFFSNGANEAQPVITRITISYKGTITELPLENIVIVKDFTPALNSVYLPQSRIQAIEYPINNIIGAYDSRHTLIRKRGPQYVISNNGKDAIGTTPMTPQEREEIERNFSYRYGLTKGQMQAIITSASINVQTIGYDVNQLRLHEEVKESSIAVCSGLSYPPFLLGIADATYNNQAEASRGLYMETIIPEALSICDQWNAIFQTQDYGITITKDYSHVSALQEDKSNAATARKLMDEALEKEFKNNVITLDRWRSLQDEDPVGDEYGAMYYYQLVQQGWTFGNTTLSGGDTKPVGDTATETTQTVNNGTAKG